LSGPEPLKESLNKSFDELRTNGKLLIPFVASLSNALLSVVEGLELHHLVQGFLRNRQQTRGERAVSPAARSA